MTVSEAIDRYIKSKYTVLSPSTVNGYIIIRRNQLQNLMSVNLTDITSELYQSAINRDMLKYSSKSISNAVGLVNAAVKMFAPEIQSKLFVTKPQKTKASFYIPEEDEIDIIYSRIKKLKPILIKPFLLASQCGLRPSEIAALSGESICKGHIEIKSAIVLDHKGKPVRKAPKTYAGYRSIPISNQIKWSKFSLKILTTENSHYVAEYSPKKLVISGGIFSMPIPTYITLNSMRSVTTMLQNAY